MMHCSDCLVKTAQCRMHCAVHPALRRLPKCFNETEISFNLIENVFNAIELFFTVLVKDAVHMHCAFSPNFFNGLIRTFNANEKLFNGIENVFKGIENFANVFFNGIELFFNGVDICFQWD